MSYKDIQNKQKSQRASKDAIYETEMSYPVCLTLQRQISCTIKWLQI